MILKVELYIVLMIILTGIYVCILSKLFNKYKSGWLRLFSALLWLGTLLYTASIYVPINGAYITDIKAVEAQPSKVFPKVLTRISEHDRKLYLYESKNNVKSISTISRNLDEFEETINNEFKKYDEDLHDTIILTTVKQTSLGKHSTDVEYRHLDELPNETLYKLGIDEELLSMMNLTPLHDIILIIANRDTIQLSYNTYLSYKDDPIKQANQPFWSIPDPK